MDEGGYAPLYVVDSHAVRSPPRLSRGRRHVRRVQTLLVLLVSVALCGMVIEACLIFRLYRSHSASASHTKLIADEGITADTMKPSPIIVPSKPVAHLTDGQDVVHGNQTMAWSMDDDPILHEMAYKDKSLVIQKEGYYYVYSKVSFFDTDIFRHNVNVNTKLYIGKSIPLLTSVKFSKLSNRLRSNSYLGGVFHLNKDDALVVEVSDSSRIWRHKSTENIFGAYMI